MAIPTVVAIGALTTGTAPITPAMPTGLNTNDILILQIQNVPPTLNPTIANAAGGTWSAVGGGSGSLAGPGVRGTWLWSRFNGTQTAPTLSNTGSSQTARIIAVRDCVTSGSPIHAEAGGAPTFAQALSTLPTLTTISNDCLILDCIVGELPDATGTGVFGTWTNGALSTPAEVYDDSVSTGTGGSLAINTGGLHISGAAGTTTVAHASMRVAYKKIALTPAVVSVARIDKNARCQPVINGAPRFLRGIYDSGLPAFQNFVNHVAARDFARYKFDVVLNVQAGTFGNALRYANALAPLGMFTLAISSFFNGFTFDPATFNPAGDSLDARNNSNYTIAPQPTGAFRDLWRENPNAAGTYIGDEPVHQAVGWSGDPAPIPVTRALDDCVVLHQLAKSSAPNDPTMVTFINDNISQWVDWSPTDFCDWLGADIYTVGTAPEVYPHGGGPGTESTYGYMNFTVCEAASLGRYYGPLFGRVPHVVLGFLKFGTSSRFITNDELWSHMVVAVAELRGVGTIFWWAMGVQNGALEQASGLSTTADGTTTLFLGPSGIVVEDAVDVVVTVAGVVQTGYTLNNVGDYSLVRSGNFWVPANPFSVTLATPPANGATVNVTVQRWPIAKKNNMKQQLEDITHLLDDLEPILIQPSNPALLTSNSLQAVDFLTWRLALLNLYRIAGGLGPVWLNGARIRYQVEYDLLNQVPPVFSSSVHIMDQSSDVRTCCWEQGTTGIVASHNVNPDPRTGTLQWHLPINRVEVLGEARDVPVNADGRSWTDTWGGGSSLRQGPFRNGHLYRLTITGASGPIQGSLALTGVAPGRVRSTVLAPGATIA